MDDIDSTLLELSVTQAIDSIGLGNSSPLLRPDVLEKLKTLKDAGIHTSGLTALLRSHLIDLAKRLEERRMLLYLNIIYEKLFDYMNQFRQLEAGASRAKIVHSLLDSVGAQTNLDPKVRDSISCRKSCSFCCHTPVEIGPSEGQLIGEHITKNRIEWDGDRPAKQIVAHKLSHAANLLSWDDSACAFLDAASECQIYSVRPLSCRKLLAISHPNLCDPRDLNSPSYIMQLESEIIASAFHSIEYEAGRAPVTLASYLYLNRLPS